MGRRRWAIVLLLLGALAPAEPGTAARPLATGFLDPVTFESTITQVAAFDRAGGGVLLIDDTHRDVVLNTMKKGMVLPLSTMPGEQVSHVYQGPMEAETIHFVEAVALDHPVLVTPEQARQVMEVTLAADLSAESHRPVSLPL